jgi:hypothetical protein
MSAHISLTEFRPPVAVVDWVAINVELKRNSNGGHIKSAYEHLGVSHALALDKGAGGAASRFEVRIQHPASYEALDALLTELDTKYGLAATPTLTAIEVSIDFYHEDADNSALASLTERLMLSLAPSVIENPRIVGEDWNYAAGLIPSRKVIDATKTLYIGNRNDDLMWRVYWKQTDETFLGEDGKRVAKPLPHEQYRVRVEVQIQGKALADLNLIKVTDLRDFSYERLHTAGLFKFATRKSVSTPIFRNPYSAGAGKALGIDDDSPACVMNLFGRRDKRKRVRKSLSRHLITDRELAEASRYALRQLSRRF